jgi:hypothetical protein
MVSRLSWPSAVRPSVALALSLGLVSAALRLPRALTSPFWQDEVASARILDEHSFAGMLRHVVRTESTPPLWYALGWVVHRAGVPIYDVRLVSVAENFALVTLVVLLAARLVPLSLAAFAGLLVALGGEFSAQGRWIRAYELFALLAVALVFAAAAAAAEPTRVRLGGLAAVVAAGSLTHYFFLFTVAATFAWLCLDPGARPGRRRTAAAMGAGMVPFVLWSPAFAAQLEHRRYSWIGGFDARVVLETPLRLFTPFGSGAAGLAGTAIVCGLCAWGAVRLWLYGAFGRLCACAIVVPLLLAAATWASGARVYAVRNMIGVGPFLAVAAVAGLGALPRSVRLVGIPGVLILAVGSFAMAQRPEGPVFNRIASALVAEGWRAGDAVVVFGNRSEFRSPLGWYLPRHPNLVAATASPLRPPVFVVGAAGTLGSETTDLASRRVANLVVARVGAAQGLDAELAAGANVFLSRPPRRPSTRADPGDRS